MSATTEQARRKFHTLDGMRGVAALLVVTRHGAQFFAPFEFPNSFLAVDLFFILSGFVIAAAYDSRLASGALTPARFMLVRYIRLWPLYILGTALGLLILYSKTVHGKSGMDLASFWIVVPTHILMLPSPVTSGFFAANNVAWSLAFELLANLAYAYFHRRASNTLLLFVAVCGMLALPLAWPLRYGLNNGFLWQHWWVGLARVAFAFPVGVLLFRYRARLPRFGIPPIFVLVFVAATLMLRIDPAYNDIVQLVSIVVVFPLLVVAAVEVEPARKLVPLFTWLGVTSYAIYTLHLPLFTLFEFILSKFDVVFSDYSPWAGIAALIVIAFIAWMADRAYDVPVRAWLTRHTALRPAAAVSQSGRVAL